MKQTMYQTMFSYVAILAGVSALAYAYYFVIARDVTMYSFFLMLLGLFSLEVFVMLYGRLKHGNENLARVAMVFGVIGAAGTAVHGGYDLANAINPPAALVMDLPNQVDPRGLLAFGFTGVAILKFAWIMAKDTYFPKWLGNIGYVSGALLVVVYLGRLIVLDPTNPLLLYPVLIEGFIFNPLWYILLGFALQKKM